MTIKERLRAYRDLVLYIRQLERDMDDLYSKAESMKLNQNNLGTQVQSFKDPDPIGEIVSEIMDIANIQAEKIERLKEETQAVEDLIQPLTFWEKRLILLRYFDGCSWAEVAADMVYSEIWVKQRHGEILQKLEE